MIVKKQPLISVALCTYNGELYIEEQLTSILNQTYTNIEIIVVDDGSTDNTVGIIEQIGKKYPQIKVYKNEFNLGYNKNFETAFKACNGDYIAISDQDDIWITEKLEILLNQISNNWLVFSNSQLINEKGELLGKQLLDKNFSIETRDFRSCLFYNSVTGHTSMFSKNFLKYLIPIPEQGYYDWYMGFIAMYHTKITYVSQCLTLHRIHQASATFKTQDKKTKKALLRTETATNLTNLQTYSGLLPADRKLISRIANSYWKKNSLFLIKLIFDDYEKFFPDLKPRSGLSRLNFAIKV
ncbi:glycosyltransferase family 2 protein [Pedobacter xixiisoli]|uniref:Glycosyltransferase involved in cell wall bisynthesis n=1 Tax=Pedobacter xixiisoli TaxID=1476464 RepID=A0A286AD69_9SPHI|nr:glycosyltransferase family 2 protein [Pedobacter xixiisoli]SOD19851.1 Glycosyltransferase involved in cell wall bisynthesis [Pedobacter xixiisoli]